MPQPEHELQNRSDEAPRQGASSSSKQPAAQSDGVFPQIAALPPKPAGQNASVDYPGAAMPPGMAAAKQYTADEVVSLLNRTPLFMTELDETDGEGGENVELEALKALAYEGTRAEIAQNFREQGNELAKAKRWKDAKEYYTKAVAALKARPTEDQLKDESVHFEQEQKTRRELEELCYVNRALCNLELKNYRSCNLDCASALRLNPRNVKAWFRSASACLALDKIAEAADACQRGLEVDATNSALTALSTKVRSRKEHLDGLEKRRREREDRERAEAATLKLALKQRNVASRTTDKAPELEDAVMKLERPLDASSTLTVPVVLLYPLHLQSDFIKAFAETETLLDHLSYILPLPWDEKQEYAIESADCYMETIAGGLIKAGKKLPLRKLLESGKIEIVDGLLRVQVVPKARAQEWIDDFKAKANKA